MLRQVDILVLLVSFIGSDSEGFFYVLLVSYAFGGLREGHFWSAFQNNQSFLLKVGTLVVHIFTAFRLDCGERSNFWKINVFQCEKNPRDIVCNSRMLSRIILGSHFFVRVSRTAPESLWAPHWIHLGPFLQSCGYRLLSVFDLFVRFGLILLVVGLCISQSSDSTCMVVQFWSNMERSFQTRFFENAGWF